MRVKETECICTRANCWYFCVAICLLSVYHVRIEKKKTLIKRQRRRPMTSDDDERWAREKERESGTKHTSTRINPPESITDVLIEALICAHARERTWVADSRTLEKTIYRHLEPKSQSNITSSTHNNWAYFESQFNFFLLLFHFVLLLQNTILIRWMCAACAFTDFNKNDRQTNRVCLRFYIRQIISNCYCCCCCCCYCYWWRRQQYKQWENAKEK